MHRKTQSFRNTYVSIYVTALFVLNYFDFDKKTKVNLWGL